MPARSRLIFIFSDTKIPPELMDPLQQAGCADANTYNRPFENLLDAGRLL